jgi:ATP-dependent helicase/nuclease subunit A
MTVHKSKGLEFDCVILPGLHRPPRNGDTSLLLWEEFVDGHGDEHLVVAPVKPNRKRDDKKPTAYDYLRTLDAEREANESSRVLYVAATRAIRSLHLVAAATVEDKDNGPALKPPRKGAPLAALWPAVEAEFNAALQSRSEEDAAYSPEEAEDDFATFIPKLTRLSLPALPAQPQDDVAEAPPVRAEPVPQGDFLRGVEAQQTPDEANRPLLADIGTLAHRLLELIAQDGLDQWNPERITAAQPGLRRWLQGRGHAATLLDDAVARCGRRCASPSPAKRVSGF